MTEKWVDIIGYEGYYQISNTGRIRSLSRYVKHPAGTLRLIKSRERKIVFDSDGYCLMSLCKENKSITYKVHRLVAIHFILNPNSLPQINHIDKVKTNNIFTNLEWSQDRENNTHSWISRKKASKFTGITKNARCKTWRSSININGKNIYLGSFKTEKDAAKSYITALSNYSLTNKYAKL